MPIRKSVLIVIMMMVSFGTSVHNTKACECFLPLSLVEEFEESIAVFHGEVIDHNIVEWRLSTIRRIHFRVIQSWKSIRSHRVCVLTAVGIDSLCGLPVTVGEQLLVYAGGNSAGLNTSYCSRTGQLVDGALGDIDFFSGFGYEPLQLNGPEYGNFDGDELLELSDFAEMVSCMTDPCSTETCDPKLFVDPCCAIADFDVDGDVDLRDVAAFQLVYNGD